MRKDKVGPIKTDVAVIGSGAAGTAAGLTVAEGGGSVINNRIKEE